MLKEQVADEVIKQFARARRDTIKSGIPNITQSVLFQEFLRTYISEGVANLFKAEVDKLTVMNSSAILIAIGKKHYERFTIEEVSNAQLQDIKKQLLERLEKDRGVEWLYAVTN